LTSKKGKRGDANFSNINLANTIITIQKI